MKLKTIKYLGLASAIAAGLTFSAKADLIIDYTWVQDSTTIPGYTSSGAITYDATSGGWGIGDTITFSEMNVDGTETVMNLTGSAAILPPGQPSGDLQLSGSSFNITGGIGGTPLGLFWMPNGATSSPTEQLVADNTTLTGAWVPVPEPTTLIAGAMLLLPFGASTLRGLRKNRSV